MKWEIVFLDRGGRLLSMWLYSELIISETIIQRVNQQHDQQTNRN